MTSFCNDPIIIGVDTGNKMIKTANNVFHSGLKKLDGAPPIQPKDPMDVIKYDNTYYIVSTERLGYSRDKTANNDYLLLTLIGLAKELRYRSILAQGAHIVLSLGLPPGHLKEPLISRYQEYFGRNNGLYRFECGGVTHQINIGRVLVNPQGLACLFVDKQDLLQKQDLTIIDIGGYTVDVIHMVNGSPDLERTTSLNHGTIPFYRRVINEMNARFDRRISEYHIDSILLQNGSEEIRSYFTTEQLRLINEEAESHVKKLFVCLNELGIERDVTFVVFTGGGSILLREWLERYTTAQGDYIIIKDIAVNAKGYEVFARARLTKGR